MKGVSRYLRLSLLLTLLIIVAVPTVTHAILMCRSDPKVYLTNGVKIEIGATIFAAASDVVVVNYVLHVPIGVGMARPEHSMGWTDVNETFTLVSDMPPNQYYVTTEVIVRDGSPSFISHTNIKNRGQTLLNTAGVAGDLAVTEFTVVRN